MADIIESLLRAVTELQQRIGDIDRRMDSSVRHGKVTDVDTKKQLARIEIGESDGKPVKSAWVPYSQVAGSYKSHRPPSVGQQMTLMAPNGEIRQALLMPMTWSDDNKSPSEKEDEHVTTFGKLKITEKGESYDLEVEGAKISMSKDKITKTVGESQIEMTPGTLTIKGTSIVLDGDVKLGGAGASRELALKDSTTMDADTINGNLSTKVKAI